MSYYLGIDLGTTYTAAAIWRDGRVEIAELGSRTAVIPSVVLLRSDGQVLTGEAAERRAITEPLRVARQFKRRFGDPTPLLLGGTPYSPEALTAQLIRSVVNHVSEMEGQPAGFALSHPANWGTYKTDLLQQSIRMADLDRTDIVSEPEAAAIHYASQERVEVGSVIAVYDLGGGTFDAAVLRRTEVGWEILGRPEGIERLGGIDFDEAVLHHVARVVGEPFEQLDPDDPSVQLALSGLRQQCVEAKEALASDTDVTIPVLLPGVRQEVRLTRSEFEGMIRPALVESTSALERALRAADIAPDEVSAVLLVGGSSRIPLVGEVVGAAFNRPVALDAHPKHGVALGTALIAADSASPGAATTSSVEAVIEDATPASLFWARTTLVEPPWMGDPSQDLRDIKGREVFRVNVPPESAVPPQPEQSGALWHGLDGWPPSRQQSAYSAPDARAAVPVRRDADYPDDDDPLGLDQPSEQGRRRAVQLVAAGLLVLVLSFAAALAVQQNTDPGTTSGVPGGVKLDANPGAVNDPSRTTTTAPHPATAAPTEAPATTAPSSAGGGRPGPGAPPPSEPPPSEPPPPTAEPTTTSTTSTSSTTTEPTSTTRP